MNAALLALRLPLAGRRSTPPEGLSRAATPDGTARQPLTQVRPTGDCFPSLWKAANAHSSLLSLWHRVPQG
ncbi:hypothetical protein LW131_09750 [Riemerella anatipestifer]|nr:hypothetical protein [Riemerella anatipestifer]